MPLSLKLLDEIYIPGKLSKPNGVFYGKVPGKL
jgi:hypothetical protein